MSRQSADETTFAVKTILVANPGPSEDNMEPARTKRVFSAARILFPVGAVLALVAGFLVYCTLIISRQESFLDDRGLRPHDVASLHSL